MRVSRLLGVFCPWTDHQSKDRARNWWVNDVRASMALHERSILDPQFGDYVNHDFAGYHIATNADVGSVEGVWVEDDDPHVNALGAKGKGEIGIVGTAAAIANAVYHAIGIRDLPITPDKVLLALISSAHAP